MEKVKLILIGILIFLGNLAFFYFAVPDSLPGRLVIWAAGGATETDKGNPKELNLAFQCNEPLPEFTLGPESNPSEEVLGELCACVWRELPDAAREFAELISGDPSKSRSETAINAFAANFGVAMKRCGAMDL